MFRKIVAVWVSLAMLFGFIMIVDVVTDITPPVKAASTLYVGGAGPGNYSNIQWAIDNATDGDTVFVYNGTYYENVVVNKAINLIGEDRSITTIDGNNISDVILVTTNWVNITGFRITNGGTFVADSGIELHSVRNCVVDNCNVSSNDYYGIFLQSSSENIITGNTITDCDAGIMIKSSSNNNSIKGNYISSINWYGIVLWLSSNNNTISENNVTKNKYGIYLSSDANNNTIINNKVTSNTNDGIHIYISSNNRITWNHVLMNNWNGIYLEDSLWNYIYHNNIISNTNQAYDDQLENEWDNGYPLGGNFWSDYGGADIYKGPGQDIPGSDGIGDSSYVIDADSQDIYPLMEPYKPLDNYLILKYGWNLISTPLIQVNQDLLKVLEMIDGYYDAVQWYDPTEKNDPWKHYRPGKLFGNDLSNLNETMGFWIHINQPGDTIFLYNGTQPASNQSITLYPGWNMVGYPSLSNRNRTATLNNINYGSDVDAIWTFNAETQTWQEIGPTDYFELGKGYWMHSKVTKIWDVPL